MLSSAAIAFVSILAALPAQAATGLSLKVSGPASILDVDALTVGTTLTNTGDESLRLLNDPRTVLTPKWKTNSFHVASEAGAVPKFQGVKVKYSPKIAAAEKAYTILEPGESITLSHDLAGVYNFNTTGAGKYSFTPLNTFTHVTPSGDLETIHATTPDVHTLEVSGKLVSRRTLGALGPANGALAKRISYSGCTAARQTTITSAVPVAQSYAEGALSYLNAHTAATTRYTTWFGTYTAARHTTLISHYTHISDGQLSTNTYDCTCTESGTYAYVYPDQPGKIYLCPVFWSTGTSGTDSRGGTLVHESSHFTKNGGTDDHVYGQSGCKSLAKSDPASAVDNADSHEYFAENTPSQA